MEKKGAIQWTVGKLVNIILLVVVLALVLYGTTTGGLNPLLENLKMKFDEVKILLGAGDDELGGECRSSKISELGGGDDFLKSMGGGEDAVLEVCRDGICIVSGEGMDKYRFIGGKIQRLESGIWKDYDFSERALAEKGNWEKYNAGVDLLEASGLGDIYYDAISGRFILYGDGEGIGRQGDSYAMWQNGEWRVVGGLDWNYDFDKGFVATEDVVRYVGSDDSNAIGAFANIVRPGDQDAVTWEEEFFVRGSKKYESKEGRNSIGTLIGGNDEIENDVEQLNLIFEFRKIKKKLTEEVKLKISENEITKISTLNGESIKIGKKEFNVSIEDDFVGGDFEFPLIVFDSGDEKFGLRFDTFGKTDSGLLENVELRYFPVSFVEWDGSAWKEVGDEEIYRLPESRFKEMLSGGLVGKFLREKCK